MRYLVLSAVLLSGCSPMTQMVQHGNDWIQISQSANLWDSNAVVVTKCKELDNGFCPEGSPTEVVVMNGPMPGIAGAGVQGVAMLGSAAIIADGLKGGRTKVTQKNKTDIRASTVNPK